MFNSRRTILAGQPIDASSSLSRGLILWVNFAEGAGRQIQDKSTTRPTSRSDIITVSTNSLYSGLGGNGIRLIASSSQYCDSNRDTQFNFSESKWAVSICFRVVTGSTTYCLFGKQGAGNSGGWGVFILNTGDIQVVFKQNGLTSNAYIRHSSSTTLGDGKWHTVSISLTSSSVAGECDAQIYVDGRLDQVAPTSTTGSNCTASGVNLRIGARESGNYFDGFIADARVWKRHLSLPEIAMLSDTANIGLYKAPNWLYVAAAAASGTNRKYSFIFG